MNQFLMVHNDGRVVCFNLCIKKLTCTPAETRGDFVGYVNSIVSVMGHNHKPESIENNCSDKGEDEMVVVDGKRESCRRRCTYSIWAIQPADVSHRIKKVMEGIRAEFGSMPYLSLPYAKLTEEEERKTAREMVDILDESITSSTFHVTRFALYEIDYDGKSLKPWTKIDEIGH